MTELIAELVDKGLPVRRPDQDRCHRPERRRAVSRMRTQGVNTRAAKQRIGARKATLEGTRLLDEPRGHPVLPWNAPRTTTPAHRGVGTHAYRDLEVTLVAH